MKSKKKKSKRDNVKYPALERHYIARIKQEYLDYDYLSKLSDKDKEWLNRFTEEELNANFKHKGDKIITDNETQKQIYHKNNARQRCTYSRSKAKNAVKDAAENEIDITYQYIVDEQDVIDLLYQKELLTHLNDIEERIECMSSDDIINYLRENSSNKTIMLRKYKKIKKFIDRKIKDQVDIFLEKLETTKNTSNNT